MQTYWLTDRTNGEVILVDGDTIERLLGVELGYVEWCIRVYGMFESGKWKTNRPTKDGKQTFYVLGVNFC